MTGEAVPGTLDGDNKHDQVSASDDCTSGAKNGNGGFSKIRKIWSKLLYLPYFVGIVWTCLHPRFSILTGESKCRGSYIDENALDTHFASIRSYNDAPIPSTQQPDNISKKVTSLCDHFRINMHIDSSHPSPNKGAYNGDSSIICHRHGELFDIAAVVPVSNAIEPHEEAIVIIVSGTDDWEASHFHNTLIHWFNRLANPIDIPWLAKTVYVVSPPPARTAKEMSNETSLEDTVSYFLDAYLGSKDQSSLIPPLPPHLSRAMIRNLIVLEVDTSELKIFDSNRRDKNRMSSYSHLTILPQGRRGLLPNMDLVFIVGQLFQRATFINTRVYPKSTFTVHPYISQTKMFQEYLGRMTKTNTNQPANTKSMVYHLRSWAEDMANLCLFAYTMALGPFPPHSPALDRGIDSVTIQAKFHGTFATRSLGGGDPVVEVFQLVEYLVRALSNLHERLHHSITLYLLPSPNMFVSHVEYLLPNLLVLLPFAMRALGILIWDMKPIGLSLAGMMSLIAFLSAVGWTFVDALTDFTIFQSNALLITAYLALAMVWRWLKKSQMQNNNDLCGILDNMQFVVCLTAIFIHVPIAFAHVSLAYPSSLLWTVLLALPRFSGSTDRRVFNGIGLFVCFITAPPCFLVPTVFPAYTTYLQVAYIPLHIQYWILLLTRII